MALESALDGMKPLLSRMDLEIAQKALGYASVTGTRRLNAADVEFVEMRSSTSVAAPESAPASAPASAPLAPVAAAPAPKAPKAPKSLKPPKAKRTLRAPKASPNPAAVATSEAVMTQKFPATGTEFWMSCMGKRRHTINEIVDRALVKLQMPETARPTLYNRLNAWIYPKVKTGELVSPGEKGGLKLYQIGADAQSS